MKLDHTIIPCSNNETSARFYTDILSLEYCGEYSHFVVVKVDCALKLLFDTRTSFESHHYAFQTSQKEYDSILARIKKRGYPFGNGPANRTNAKEYEHEEEKGFYFDDKDGHILEVITQAGVCHEDQGNE